MKKNKILFLVLTALFLTHCSTSDNKSDAYGNFEADEITISSQVKGQVLELNIEEGDHLTKNKTIAVIDTTQLTLKRKELQEKIKTFDASKRSIFYKILAQNERIKNIRIEKLRLKKLLKDSATTQKQWDNITGKLRVEIAQLKSIKSNIDQIEHNKKSALAKLEQIQDNINKCYIKNPFTGTVLEKYINNYEIVTPGRPLYKIANLKKMYLRAYISGDRLSHIKLGQKVTILFDKNKKDQYSIHGTITWISDNAEFTPKIIQTKDVRVDLVYAFKVKINNDGRIKIGMPGEVKF